MAKQHVELPRNHKRLTTKSIQRHRATFHPIRSLPPELLSQVFEHLDTFYGGEYPGLLEVTRVSHVCRLWRAVALKTPKLWTDVFVDFEDQEEDILAFWTRVTTHIWNARAVIRFENVGWSSDRDDKQMLETCRLDTIPVIAKLELAFQNPKFETFDLFTNFAFPEGTLGHLEIEFNDGVHLDDEDEEDELFSRSWNWSAFFHQFPPFERLRLEIPALTTFHASMPLPALKQVKVWSATKGIVENLLSLCPNATELTVKCQSRTNIPTASTLTMHQITYLEIETVHELRWATLFKYPALKELVYLTYRIESLGGLGVFLIAHSFTTLNLSLEKAPLKESR